MSQEKIIEGWFVSSKGKKFQQLKFNPTTGLITAVGELNIPQDEVDYKFNEQQLIFAGMGDVHIHAREDASGKNCYKETFLTASQAAKNGGEYYHHGKK